MAKRPDATTMEGMLWNSLRVLEKALDPDTVGIPKALFYDAKGIVIISIAEAGFIFSGSVGTGIIMSRKDVGKWSPPSAVGMAGVGFGFLAGAAMKDVIIFIMDDATLKAYSGDVAVKLGSQINLTLGTLGRDAQVNLHASDKGFGGAVAVAFSKGAFVSAALEGGSLRPRPAANEAFYGKAVTPQEILLQEDVVEIPDNSIIPEIHDMLESLADGSVMLLSEEVKEKVESARVEAVQAGQDAKLQHDDIVSVETEKEKQAQQEKTET